MSHLSEQLKSTKVEQRLDEYGNTMYDAYVKLGVHTKKTFIAAFQQDRGSDDIRLVSLYRKVKK